MGCDIHLYSETKKNGEWVPDYLDQLSSPTAEEQEDGDFPQVPSSYEGMRNYGLFGLLADVRYGTPHGWDARGLPEDVSPVIKAMSDAWDGDGHSHSYLTMAEMKNEAMKMLVMPDEDTQYLGTALTNLIAGLPKTDNPNPEEQRIVFWFDN